MPGALTLSTKGSGRNFSIQGSTLRAKLRNLPELMTEGLRPAQIAAIRNLEKPLAADRPCALIQMASGGGKTFTACDSIYRLIKHAGAKTEW